MQLTIQSHHFHPGEELMSDIRNKFNHLTRFYDRITQCQVVVSKENNSDQKNCIIEAIVEVPRKSIFAREMAYTFEQALEGLLKALEQQLKHHKAQLERIR